MILRYLVVGKFFVCAALLSVCAVVPSSADEIKIDPELNGESQTGREWLDAKFVMRGLASKIVSALPADKAKDAKETDAFLKSPKNRLALARWRFMNAAGADAVVERIQKLDVRRTFFQFLSDEKWLDGYLYTGTPTNADKFLDMLLAIAAKDKKMVNDPTLRKIATATAAEFSRNGWSLDKPARAVKRYRFFAESWRAGKLNAVFDELDYWDMRIVCGWKGDNDFGNEYSMRWARDNVKLTEEGYASAYDIHQLDYRLWNKAGDSVHNPDYYAPFRRHFSTKKGEVNMSAMSLEVGAVCGGISHYGVSGAVSNGVPALTMGEPGHCAFAVRVNGQWRDNNSVSHRRDLHWRLLDGGGWTFIFLTQDLFSDAKKTPDSFRKAALARFFAETGKNRAAASALYSQALAAQPLNYLVWRDACGYAKSQKANRKFWLQTHDKFIAAFAGKYPEVCATGLRTFVYPQLLAETKTDEEKLKLFDACFAAFKTKGPATWDMESFWEAQCAHLSADGKKKFVESGKRAFKGNPDYEKIFSDWASGNSRNKED